MGDKRVAIVLAGCGVYDGSEIYETVITLLQLEQRGAHYQCFAPDIAQHHVINHLTGAEMDETRNVLIESARLARGRVKPLTGADAAEFDALIVPGGFGVAKNLSDFALAGSAMQVNRELLDFAHAFRSAGKPVGLICIAPAMATAIFGDGVKCTIGDDADTAAAITRMGGTHVDTPVDQICVDERNRLVSTPAYMLAGNLLEAKAGIDKLVDKVLQLA